LGIGDWGLGIGDWGLGPIPNPQSPIPNYSLFEFKKYYLIKLFYYKKIINTKNIEYKNISLNTFIFPELLNSHL
jgi:hypothetical protein